LKQSVLKKKPRKKLVFCNAVYDIGWLNTGFGLDAPDGEMINDVSCEAMMLDENRRAIPGFPKPYGLDAIANWCGLPGKDETLLRDAAFSYGYKGDAVKAHIADIPARYVGPYAGQDAVATLLSHEHMIDRLMEECGDAYSVEMQLIPLIFKMRKRGIRLNEERAAALYDTLMARYEAACQRVYDITKMRVSIDELRQRDWLIRICDMHGIDEYKKEGENGKEDTEFSKSWMRASAHPLPRAIAEAKQCHEAATKFVSNYLLKYVYRGRIHANINQFLSEDGGTRSHRFSYSEPPLQQMPSRPDPVEGWDVTEIISRELRMSFEPEEGELWFAPDYSQQEYRLIVHYAYLMECGKADEAVAKYQEDPNTDFHNLVVDLTGLTRRRAKDVNFAKAYGAGVPKFALMTGMELEEAAQVMGQYDGEMPFVKELNEICEREAQRKGYIKLIDGARSHFDDWECWLSKSEREAGWRSGKPMAPCRIDEARRRQQDEWHPWHGKRIRRADTRKAMNRLIQGSAARQVKRAMLACYQAGYVPMIQMHDELGFSLTKEKDGQIIGQIMREIIKVSVPMRVDEEYGETWGTAKYKFAEARLPGKGRPPALSA
jgi:DNA polymerase I-like protein with 3'-5' exonuclease and polymerase domains